jgi:hypothetical protein
MLTIVLTFRWNSDYKIELDLNPALLFPSYVTLGKSFYLLSLCSIPCTAGSGGLLNLHMDIVYCSEKAGMICPIKRNRVWIQLLLGP